MCKDVMIHIGKKAPKGYEELPGGIHLGKGIWMLKIRKKNPTEVKK
jgi:hypothetical protein